MNGKAFDKTQSMRLGIVPYLNCIPLVHGLDCEIFEAPPSKLVEASKPEDIVLAPIVTAFLDPSWYLFDGVAIGSFGPVDTVRLFFKDGSINIQNINEIHVDTESVTSTALLKVLLEKKVQRPRVQLTIDKTKSVQGSLLIGDKVWKQNGNRPSMDLGEVWTEWTKLPFVYACWMTKNRELGLEWKSKLIKQARYNLSHLEEIGHTQAISYWRQLVFDLGPLQKKAITLFQNYWAHLEQKPLLDLKWI